MTYPITNQKDLRSAFWEQHPQYKRKGRQSQNDYPTDVRCAWVEFTDAMCRSGQISDALAQRAVLG